MKRLLVLTGLLLALASRVGQAQTRVGVSLSFGDPYVGGHIVIGRPYHPYYPRSYSRSRFYDHYYSPPPRYYREPRMIVVRPYHYHRRGYHRGW